MKDTSAKRTGRPPLQISEGMAHRQQIAITVIDAIGGTNAVAKLCRIRPPSVTYWKEAGIPKGWEMFLREKFPHLSAWQQLDSTEDTTA